MLWQRYQEIEQSVQRAAQKTGRANEKIKLIAVSKTKPLSMVRELAEHFASHQPRGEYVLVLAGAPEEAKKEIPDEEIALLIRDYAKKGMKNKDAAKTAAQQLGINKNRAYEIMIKTLGN